MWIQDCASTRDGTPFMVRERVPDAGRPDLRGAAAVYKRGRRGERP
eukprot:CAMPEP_0116892876 /NCGR_PEP_ID=MMETSP0467-20121206/3004_1 /TAXON_ID=283647 /ORGANISM="Mesodinium pulex, Strain SPMC105" /LENGTH=45 /DNA_ID= /DNA_START= /DNA_END= /DNA_ORIENTATION=